jgi:hypothetical protein
MNFSHFAVYYDIKYYIISVCGSIVLLIIRREYGSSVILSTGTEML